MAINPSNSNAINIVNLPNAQLAVAGDYLILQTANGTQKINFTDFNVVRTDIAGNATVIGDISGNGAIFSTATVLDITARNFHTTAGQGINGANGFYNRLTIQDGLILSATQNTFQDPVYTQITNFVIPATISQITSSFKQIIDEQGMATLQAGFSSWTVTINGFFPYGSITSVNSITPNMFTFMPKSHLYTSTPVSLSGVWPIVQNIRTNIAGSALIFDITVPAYLRSTTDCYWRMLMTY